MYSGDARYVLQGWSSGPVTVSSPLTLYKVYKVQYRIRVEPGEGRAWVEEGEWVDEGSVATVRVESTRLGFPLQTVLDGFHVEGGSILEQSASEGWARVRVTGPTKVHALWRRDYTPLHTLAVAAVAVAAGSVLLVARRRLQAAGGREAEAKPAPAATPEAAATQPSEEARVISPDELERELEKLAREAEEHREFLERLETLRAEGRISESTYEELRRERLGMLEALEARVRELESIRRAATVRSTTAQPTTKDN